MSLVGDAREESIFDLLPLDRAELVRSPGGIMHVWRPARGLFVTRIEGIMKLDLALAVETTMRKVAAEDGRFIGLHDWQRMTDYESEGRVRLTRATVDVRSSVEAAHLLIASRAVALAVQAANLVVKILNVHTSRADFHQAVRDALARKRR